ncbi:4548_t:CDS:2 [Dentiscutata erythropus]|uniref:4548_t:CDS:1 n=1 Tax=Dentiscutata erythropus TaxID=1348616 RepID=A0A9N9J0F4_9GLOM|nr:4548_t:CDS:2 [Dentiscutata erythropus]
MGLIEQQAAVTALITVQAHCKNEPTKQALYEKHKEFLESQLEKCMMTKKFKEEFTEMSSRQGKRKNHKCYYPIQKEEVPTNHMNYDVPRDKEFVRENEQIGIKIPHSPTDNVFLNKRLLQASRRNEDIPQGVLLKVTKPATPSPLSQYTLSRTPTIEISADEPDRKRNERGYTPSPDPYKRKQQRYKSPSLSSKHTDQISNKEIEIPYYDNVHNEGQSSTYKPIHGTFRGQIYTTYVPETVYQELEDYKKEEFGQEVENQLKENKEGYGINDDEEYNHILLNNLTIQQKRKIVPTIIKTEKEKIFSKKETVIPPITLMSIKILNPQENGIVGTPIQLAAKGLAIQQGRPNEDYILAINISDKNIQIKQDEHIGNIEQEMRTSVNNNVISDIQFILNKKEHEIPDNDKNQRIRKYTVEEERIIKELYEDLEKNDIIYPGYSK